MKRLSILAVSAIAAAALVVVPVEGVARAEFEYEDTCGKAMPSEFIQSFSHQVRQSELIGLADPGDGALTSFAPGGVVVAAGTSSTVAATIGYTATSIATFLMAMETSCYVGDYVGLDSAVQYAVSGVIDATSWLFGSGDAPPADVTGVDDQTELAGVQAANFLTPITNVATTGVSGTIFTTIVDESLGTWDDAQTYSTDHDIARNDVLRVVNGGAINLPALDVNIATYPANASCRTNFGCTQVPKVAYKANHASYPGARFNNPIDNNNYGSNQYTPYMMVAYENCDPNGPLDPSQWTTENGNVGGVCGVQPGEYYTLLQDNSGANDVLAFFHTAASRKASTHGWQRRHVTDVQCWDGVANGVTEWVRVESDLFWDQQMTARIPVPKCQDTHIPVAWRISQVPAGLSYPLGTVNTYTMERVDAPANWITGSAPDFVPCLGQGVDCGVPSVQTVGQSDLCVWGGHTGQPQSYCDASTILDPQTTPDAAPRTVGRSVVTNPAEPATIGDASAPSTTTLEAPSGGDGGSGGGGTGVSSAEVEGGVRAAGAGTGDGECLQNYGWNPIDWILEPVKCAFLWAFVPSDGVLGAKFDNFVDELETQFPFSFVFLAADFLGDIGTEIETASGTGCFSGASTWTFGTGTNQTAVNAGDVCIGQDMTVSASQRATLLTIILAPMVFGLLRYTWAMTLGGDRSKGASA